MSTQVRSLVLITVLGTLFSFSLVGCQTSQGSRFSAKKQPPVSSYEMQPPAVVLQSTGTNAHASHQMPTPQMPALQTAGLSPAPSARSFSGGGSGKCSSCK